VPFARRELVRLEHPYSKMVFLACQDALSMTIDRIADLLIASYASPVPKDTGFLRSQLQVRINPSRDGVSLILSWPNVPYAQHLVEKAGTVNVRHPSDPMAENPWMEPSMRLVFPEVLLAIQRVFDAWGIEYTTRYSGL
jgi:hypothetical protein